MTPPFVPIITVPRNFDWSSEGAIWFQGPNGYWVVLERPGDWATIPYFLGIDQTTGYPAWLSLSGEVTSIVRVGFIGPTAQLFPPSVSRVVTLPVIGPTAVLYPPLLESVGLPFLASATVLYAPAVAVSQEVTGGHISGTQLFPPTIPIQAVTGGTIAAGTTLYPPIIVKEAWELIAIQGSISGGKLTLSGLDLTSYVALELLINDVAVTSDDTTINLRFIIGGTEITSGYAWSIERRASGLTSPTASNSATSMSLTSTTATQGVGNAAGEGFSGIVRCHAPTGTLHKRIFHRCAWTIPAGNTMEGAYAVGRLANSGDITGFVLAGSSDLTAGTLILMGLK